MQRSLLSLFNNPLRQYRAHVKTDSSALEPQQPPRSRRKRLKDIGHDLTTVPFIFCDSITEDAANNPVIVDTGSDHVIDERNLKDHLREGIYFNPFNRGVILTPQTFDVETQKHFKKLIKKALALIENPSTARANEKNGLGEQLIELSSKLNAQQVKVLSLTLGMLCHVDVAEEDKAVLRDELEQIKAQLVQYKEQEIKRLPLQQRLLEQYDAYIASLERIACLKKYLEKQTDVYHPDHLSIIQTLIAELEAYIAETSAILHPNDKNTLIAQETLLKEMLSIKITILNQQADDTLKKIHVLKDDLVKLEELTEDALEKELAELNLSIPEVSAIHHDQQAAQKLLLTRQLIGAIETFIQTRIPTSREHEVEIEAHNAWLQDLILSLSTQASPAKEEKNPPPLSKAEWPRDMLKTSLYSPFRSSLSFYPAFGVDYQTRMRILNTAGLVLHTQENEKEKEVDLSHKSISY